MSHNVFFHLGNSTSLGRYKVLKNASPIPSVIRDRIVIKPNLSREVMQIKQGKKNSFSNQPDLNMISCTGNVPPTS